MSEITPPTPDAAPAASNFIDDIINEHNRSGRFESRVHTRFPPEPNGYLHIGHAKSICLNFGTAAKYGGMCNLRFDDTNPTKEDVEYVDSIQEDVRWLGFTWDDRMYFASDYFEQLYEYAVALIRKGVAFVCDLTAEEIAAHRGTPTRPGTESPYRNRSVDENLDLFARMRKGEFPDGTRTLRAKIDLASPNMHMRDPVMYRIMHSHHHRTGDAWCIYPMYDFAHGLSDSIEGITHSICTLEFEVHRPLYDWYIEQLGVYHPQQIEFARLNLSYTVMSKRKLLELVKTGRVRGWDDPRMPTICGLRRRGYTPEAIRGFAERIGVAKRDNVIDVALLEYSVREDLNRRAARRMAVLNPLRIVLTNFPEDRVEHITAVNNPEDESAGTRDIPFTRELFVEHDDFMLEPVKKFHRLTKGAEVRLRYGYIIRCNEVVQDAEGKVIELQCTYDAETGPGGAQADRRVKGTIHWVSAAHAVDAEVRLYDRLFTVENPDDAPEGSDYTMHLNPLSLEQRMGCKLEPSMASAVAGDRVQFERLGYFCVDPDSAPGALVINKTVGLKDTWSRMSQG
jgi:glutaminyl-tRNA synthetase